MHAHTRTLTHTHKHTLSHLQDCGSRLLDLNWRKGHAPSWLGDETQYSGCCVCDEHLEALVEVRRGGALLRSLEQWRGVRRCTGAALVS